MTQYSEGSGLYFDYEIHSDIYFYAYSYIVGDTVSYSITTLNLPFKMGRLSSTTTTGTITYGETLESLLENISTDDLIYSDSIYFTFVGWSILINNSIFIENVSTEDLNKYSLYFDIQITQNYLWVSV